MTLTRKLTVFLTILASALTSPDLAQAAITNPVIGNLGNNPEQAKTGATFLTYFVTLWRAGINIGALLVLLYFAWGSIEWISSGGDKGKVEAARMKMTNAAVGIIILVSGFTIIGFFSNLVFGNDFNLLKLTFPTATTSSGTAGTTGTTPAAISPTLEPNCYIVAGQKVCYGQ